MLPVISLRVHRALDFFISIYLVSFPWINDFSDHAIASWIMMISGIFLIMYAVMTKYKKRSLRGFIPIKAHLWLDAILGIFLVGSPWVFGFSQVAYLPHMTAGIVLILMAAFSRGYPKRSEHNKIASGERHIAV